MVVVLIDLSLIASSYSPPHPALPKAKRETDACSIVVGSSLHQLCESHV
jgi:hypothetical protein